MWPVGGNSLASSTEDHCRIIQGRSISHLLIRRPGFDDITADGCLTNFLRPGGGRITFEGISEWIKSRGWTGPKRGLPFSVEYQKDNSTLVFSFIGDIMTY